MLFWKVASNHPAQLSFRLNFAHCVKKLKLVQNRARNTKLTKIGYLGQKRADIFKYAVFVLNSLGNKQFPEFCVLCQKREENNNLTKCSLNLT